MKNVISTKVWGFNFSEHHLEYINVAIQMSIKTFYKKLDH
jgi:hypothetical protein